MLTYILGCPVAIFLVVGLLVLLFKPVPVEDEATRLRKIEERKAQEKEQKKLAKAARKEKLQQWLIERARLIKEAGLDPDNPEDVQKWKLARRAEHRKQQEARMTELRLERATRGATSYTSSGSNDTQSGSNGTVYNDREFEERERMKDTIRMERKYLSDEEIRDRHEYAWGSQETNEAFKEEDKQGFLGWLFWG